MQKELQSEISGDFVKILNRLQRKPDFIIQLTPVTKKNSQQIFYNKGRPFIIQSKQYRDYEKEAGYFLRPANIDFLINITYLFYMPTRRRTDASNLIAAADDILVKYNVIQDDNYTIIKAHNGTMVLYDKENPRTEIYITDLTLDENVL